MSLKHPDMEHAQEQSIRPLSPRNFQSAMDPAISELFDEFVFHNVEHCETEAKDFIRTVNGNQRIRKIGEGGYCMVYRGTEGNVFKVGNAHDNEGFLIWLRFCRENQGNPFVPKIGHCLLIEDKDQCSAFVVEMEILYPGEKKYNIGTHGLMWLDLVHSMEKEIIRWTEGITNEILIVPTRSGDWEPRRGTVNISLTTDIFPLYEFLHEAVTDTEDQEALSSLDLQDVNVMVRSNGQIVITDPLT